VGKFTKLSKPKIGFNKYDSTIFFENLDIKLEKNHQIIEPKM
jgi:hypothetical protein